MINKSRKTNLLIILLMFLALILVGCDNAQEVSVREIQVKKMTAEELYQKMEQSNSEINKFNIELSMTYIMKRFFPEKTVEEKSQMDSTGYYDRIKKESFTKGTMTTEVDGKKEISEMESEVKGNYVTTKINGVVVDTKKTEEDMWGKAAILKPSLDTYYIPMGDNFEKLSDENVNGIDCYVLIMLQDVNKVIKTVMTSEGQTKSMGNIPESIGEVYVKMWIDKKYFHMVKTKNYLNITSEKFSWLIDGELIISNISH